MAYKFVNADQLDADLLSVADAIRIKGETTGAMTFPAGMVAAIGAISTGVELNFQVVGGTAQPANPKENDIWVNTSAEITSYIFSATEPETPAEGMLWISTSTSSAVEFNALKKNGIQVYPISAQQYINSEWVSKEAQSYQGGAWVEWWNGQLYEDGNEYADITGGIRYAIATQTGNNPPSVSMEADHIAYKCIVGSILVERYLTVYTYNVIDLTKFNTLIVVADINAVGGDAGNFKIGITQTKSQFTAPSYDNMNAVNGTTFSGTGNDVTVNYDISGYSGEYYIGVYIYDRSGSIYKIILE